MIGTRCHRDGRERGWEIGSPLTLCYLLIQKWAGDCNYTNCPAYRRALFLFFKSHRFESNINKSENLFFKMLAYLAYNAYF